MKCYHVHHSINTSANQSAKAKELIDYGNLRIGKEIRSYQENLFFGMSLRQSLFALLAVIMAAIFYRPLVLTMDSPASLA